MALCHKVLIGTKPLMEEVILNLKLNNKFVSSFKFPGGETHVRINPEEVTHKNLVTALIQSSDDLIGLHLVTDAIREVNSKAKIELFIPYLPYARQDRVCVKGEAFSLKVVCTLINNLKFDKVTVVDAHSEVSQQLLNNFDELSLKDALFATTAKSKIVQESLSIVAPDKGALPKVATLHQDLQEEGLVTPLYVGNKKRDLNTGKIISLTIEQKVKHSKFLIVDDICDGGGTFLGLAAELKSKGASEIHLFVTHGIFSKGFEELLNTFETVSCYHSLKIKHEELPNRVKARCDFKFDGDISSK